VANIGAWPPDVLRHSFASAHYAFHRDPARTAMTLGHNNQDMLLTHYRDLMKPSDAAKYWQIVPEITTDAKIVRLADVQA
jgi:integrase